LTLRFVDGATGRRSGERLEGLHSSLGRIAWAADSRSLFPWFQPQILAWMDAGGVYAVPCLRGGGEYGEPWHAAAVREKKQTSVDDYLAAADWLVANHYANPQKLVANGGSVSGAVAAAAVIALQVAARRPDRVRKLVNVDGGIMSSRSWFPESAADRIAAARSLTDANLSQFADADAWRRFNMPALAGPRLTEYHGMFMATPRDVVFQYWRENLIRDLNACSRLARVSVRAQHRSLRA
jgi:hypothetical protein